MSTYEERQRYRDEHPGAVVDNNSSSDGGFHSDTPNGTPSGGGGAPPSQTPPGTSTTDPTIDKNGMTAAERAQARQDVLKGAAASAGMSLAELAERKRQFDLELEWKKQMWANQGLPELEIKQRAQAEAIREFDLQHQLAQQNLSLAQGTLGLDYAKTAASMGGPQDIFQHDDFIRGANAASGGQLPKFLSALQNNTGLAAFGATSGAAPQAQTMAGTMGQLANGAAPDHSAALRAIGGIAQAGGAALSPQAIEALNPDELAAMGSGFRKLGYSMPAFLQQYAQSRVGQNAAQAA